MCGVPGWGPWSCAGCVQPGRVEALGGGTGRLGGLGTPPQLPPTESTSGWWASEGLPAVLRAHAGLLPCHVLGETGRAAKCLVQGGFGHQECVPGWSLSTHCLRNGLAWPVDPLEQEASVASPFQLQEPGGSLCCSGQTVSCHASLGTGVPADAHGEAGHRHPVPDRAGTQLHSPV